MDASFDMASATGKCGISEVCGIQEHSNVRKPANVSGGEILRGFPLADGNVGGVHQHVAANKAVLPLLESVHQGKHFAFMCGVVAFG